jgi:hypothetical protein
LSHTTHLCSQLLRASNDRIVHSTAFQAISAFGWHTHPTFIGICNILEATVTSLHGRSTQSPSMVIFPASSRMEDAYENRTQSTFQHPRTARHPPSASSDNTSQVYHVCKRVRHIIRSPSTCV